MKFELRKKNITETVSDIIIIECRAFMCAGKINGFMIFKLEKKQNKKDGNKQWRI